MSFVIKKEHTLFEGRWLRFLKYDVVDPDGREHGWELVERTTRAGTSDAVDIIAILKKDGQSDQIILVKQFRPAVKSWTLECPAGLIDPNETAEATAIRELFEETGYTGVCTSKADAPTLSDPGLTNSTLQTVTVTVDGDLPENQNVKPCLDDASIQTVILPLSSLKSSLDEHALQGTQVDSRLYHFAVGLSFTC